MYLSRLKGATGFNENCPFDESWLASRLSTDVRHPVISHRPDHVVQRMGSHQDWQRISLPGQQRIRPEVRHTSHQAKQGHQRRIRYGGNQNIAQRPSPLRASGGGKQTRRHKDEMAHDRYRLNR
jgi:hypothetical protein